MPTPSAVCRPEPHSLLLVNRDEIIVIYNFESMNRQHALRGLLPPTVSVCTSTRKYTEYSSDTDAMCSTRALDTWSTAHLFVL
jgi:hypothetical protein